MDDQTPTFSSPFNEDGTNNRYIVRFKSGSKTYRSRMRRAQRQRTAGRVASSSSPDDKLLKFGSFLPDDNAEVLLLNSQDEVKAWSEKDDVEYVELGKFHST